MSTTILADYADHLVELAKPRMHGQYESRYMTHASGYVMARRPGAFPYIISVKEWLALPYTDSPPESQP